MIHKKTILLKILRRISILSLFVHSLSSSEELTNVKIIGGFSADCSESTPGPSNSLQPLIFKILDSRKTGNILKAEFEVQFVECSKNKWINMKNATNEFNNSITDEIGQNMKEKISFSKFRIQILDTKGKIVETLPVSPAKSAKFNFKIRINSLDIEKDPETKTKYVDVVLLADRKRQTSADYYFDEVNWGRQRLHLDLPPKE